MTMALAAASVSPALADERPPLQQKAAPPATPSAANYNNYIAAADFVTKGRGRQQVATVRDCDQPVLAPVVWARADHGTITIKKGTGAGCGRPSINLDILYYKPDQGFKGPDKVYMLGFLVNGNIDHTYTVVVK